MLKNACLWAAALWSLSACFETTLPAPEGEEVEPAAEDDDSSPSDDDPDDSSDDSAEDEDEVPRPGKNDDKGTVDAGKGGAIDGGRADASRDAGASADAESQGPVSAPGAAQARMVTVGGAARNFLLYVPSSLKGKSQPAPFVAVFHGFTMSGKVMEDLTSWKAVAEREQFVVAFPDGGGPSPWNVGEGVCNVGAFVAAPGTQDDFAFIKAMLEDADKQQPVDEERVFVGGFSMGGYFANHVGCKARELVRAVAAHSGGTFAGDCPGEPVPVLIIHGEVDTLIPHQCGKDAHGYWLTRNKCGTGTKTEMIKMGTCEWAEGCPEGQEVGMCTLTGMDHGWAGAKFTGPWLTLQYGGGEEFEDAAELMWKFFKRYL